MQSLGQPLSLPSGLRPPAIDVEAAIDREAGPLDYKVASDGEAGPLDYKVALISLVTDQSSSTFALDVDGELQEDKDLTDMQYLGGGDRIR